MGEGILNSFDIFRPFLFPLLSYTYIYICKSIFLSKKSPLLKMARIGIDKAPRSSVNLSLAERMKEKEREREVVGCQRQPDARAVLSRSRGTVGVGEVGGDRKARRGLLERWRLE